MVVQAGIGHHGVLQIACDPNLMCFYFSILRDIYKRYNININEEFGKERIYKSSGREKKDQILKIF